MTKKLLFSKKELHIITVSVFIFRWLAEDMDDGLIEREITASGAQMLTSEFSNERILYHGYRLNGVAISISFNISL